MRREGAIWYRRRASLFVVHSIVLYFLVCFACIVVYTLGDAREESFEKKEWNVSISTKYRRHKTARLIFAPFLFKLRKPTNEGKQLTERKYITTQSAASTNFRLENFPRFHLSKQKILYTLRFCKRIMGILEGIVLEWFATSRRHRSYCIPPPQSFFANITLVSPSQSLQIQDVKSPRRSNTPGVTQGWRSADCTSRSGHTIPRVRMDRHWIFSLKDTRASLEVWLTTRVRRKSITKT